MPSRDVAAITRPFAVPAAHVVRIDSPSRSYLGGTPQLPLGAPWPSWRDRPLGFLGRICLSDLHRTVPIDWLPSSGALLFFYDIERQPWGFDPEDRGWTVIYDAHDRRRPDESRPGKVLLLPRLDIGFRAIDSYPSWERHPIKGLDLTDRELDELSKLTDEQFQDSPEHQVAGFPRPVQNDDMELECQLTSRGLRDPDDPRASALEAGAGDWKLLLQLDSDDDLGVMWGDVGMLYFWVREQDARAGHFENAWVVLQCH